MLGLFDVGVLLNSLVLGNGNIDGVSEQHTSLEVLESGGCTMAISHLHQGMFGLVEENLDADDIAVQRKQVEEDLACCALGIEIGEQQHGFVISSSGSREGREIVMVTRTVKEGRAGEVVSGTASRRSWTMRRCRRGEQRGGVRWKVGIEVIATALIVASNSEIGQLGILDLEATHTSINVLTLQCLKSASSRFHVRVLNKHLNPNWLVEHDNLLHGPVDGEYLVNNFHSHGVNAIMNSDQQDAVWWSRMSSLKTNILRILRVGLLSLQLGMV